MCNFSCEQQRYIAAMQYKIRDASWARQSAFFTTITTTLNTLIKWEV